MMQRAWAHIVNVVTGIFTALFLIPCCALLLIIGVLAMPFALIDWLIGEPET